MFQTFIWNLSLFTTICSVRTPTVQIVDKNLWYDNSNETNFAVLWHRANSFSDHFHFAKLTLGLFLGAKRLTVVEVWHLVEVRLYLYLWVSPLLWNLEKLRLFIFKIPCTFKTLPSEKGTPSFLDNDDVILLFWIFKIPSTFLRLISWQARKKVRSVLPEEEVTFHCFVISHTANKIVARLLKHKL